MSYKTITSLSLLFCFGMATPALCQEKKSKADREEAVRVFSEAERLYNVGDYAAALEKYKASYLLSGEASLLFNMAQCNRFLQNNAEAIRLYKRYLALTPQASNRAKVEEMIATLSAAPDKPSKNNTSTTQNAQETVVVPQTEPVVASAPTDKTPTSLAVPSPQTPTEPKAWAHNALYGTSAAFGVAALALGITSSLQAKQLAETGTFASFSELAVAEQDIRHLARVADIAWVLTATSAVGAFLLTPKRSEPRARVWLSPSALQVEVRF